MAVSIFVLFNHTNDITTKPSNSTDTGSYNTTIKSRVGQIVFLCRGYINIWDICILTKCHSRGEQQQNKRKNYLVHHDNNV